MKKCLIVLLSFLVAISLCGCFSKSDPREKEILPFLKENDFDGAREKTRELFKGEDRKMKKIIANIDEIEMYEEAIQKVSDEIREMRPHDSNRSYASTKLEIQKGHYLTIRNGYGHIIGRVKNTGDSDIEYFEVKVNLLDERGNILNTDYTNDVLKLEPSAMREFNIMFRWDNEYSDYELSIGEVR